jgi:glycerophosphoryl diester phosphodiesterase
LALPRRTGSFPPFIIPSCYASRDCDRKSGSAPSASLPLDGAAFAETLGAWSLNCDVDFVDETLVADAHRRGLKILVYTVDEVSDGIALASMGVDGIFTNRPDRFS